MTDKPPIAVDDIEDWEEWNPSKISFVNHMIAGSVAGLAEHIAMFPLDTIKTNIQCDRCGKEISPLESWECAMRIIRNEGVFRLWRGVTATFAGCLPAHAAYFTVYETNKKLLGVDKEGHHPLMAAVVGATAAISHDVFMTPFDTIKQRMQLGYYKNIKHCMKVMMRTEGLGAFYLAFPATLLMNIPYGGVMMAVNESAKTVLNPSGQYSFSSSMIAGSIAGSIAAALTTPLDVIKTRLQTQNFEPCPTSAVGTGASPLVASSVNITSSAEQFSAGRVLSAKISTNAASSSVVSISSAGAQRRKRLFNGLLDVVKHTFKTEGWVGFTRGIGPRMVSHAPAVAISWTAYESMKSLLSSTD